ncbi:uncharacterized protein LOC107042270 isoform X3 [Diachasma alloeum]|uniref:uncharacterized protein LOC107042270 isoform X2 n=1 Tax=Diachasma alloeum TaxID=454923 RepID=UPI0007381773|nr:uncharacterized protein LOC107042270 isoform X2 [Diachasma alloeum]XP_015118757.1 uncharacterized protein LOC107042270 isoform X3 [Diachasma alloeum]
MCTKWNVYNQGWINRLTGRVMTEVGLRRVDGRVFLPLIIFNGHHEETQKYYKVKIYDAAKMVELLYAHPLHNLIYIRNAIPKRENTFTDWFGIYDDDEFDEFEWSVYSGLQISFHELIEFPQKITIESE